MIKDSKSNFAHQPLKSQFGIARAEVHIVHDVGGREIRSARWPDGAIISPESSMRRFERRQLSRISNLWAVSSLRPVPYVGTSSGRPGCVVRRLKKGVELLRIGRDPRFLPRTPLTLDEPQIQSPP